MNHNSDSSDAETADADSDSTRPDYDPDRGAYVVNHTETSDLELSVTVVHAVLDVAEVDPTEVNLNDVVQPDSLNNLFAPKHDGARREGGTLSFRLAGCEVTVDRDEVRIDPAPDA